MNLEALLERALIIQAIPAPTFSEGARAAWLHKEFNRLAIGTAEQDPIGNVYFRIPGGNQNPVIVSAHLDSVFPIDAPLDSHRTADRLVGPGVGDNAIGIAILVELAIEISGNSPPGDIWLVANIGEEGLGNLVGMKNVVARFGKKVSAYIIIEGMAFGHIYHRGLPIRRFQLDAEGIGGHSWIHKGRPSAVHALIEVGASILNIPLGDAPKSSLNIGILHGGTTINTIASRAHFEIDLRSEDADHLAKLSKEIENTVLMYKNAEIKLHLKTIGERPIGGLPQDHALVLAAQSSLRAVGVKRCYLEAGSTDASIPLSMGFPAVCVGITKGGGAHSLEEYIEIDPIERGFNSLQSLIYAAFDIANEST
ncbi:MAG: M20/M25/M40 family metallo-hydrolase [Chloroflexi bacterium]|nr:M20/M25/M40 family metallo-hydrolase [Chloroflexota bacterium]